MKSDLVLQIALYACLVTAGLTLVLLVLITLFRWRFQQDGRRYRAFADAWQPRLVKVIMGEALPHSERLTRSGQVVLLRLWNYWSESMAGESRLRLKQHVQALGCDALAMRLVRQGNRAQKLLSVISLGNLQHTPAWPELQALIDKEDQILALHAARAMLQIDAEQAMRELLPKILVREHWELSVISNIVKGARGAFESALLAQWPQLNAQARTRAFKLCDHLNMPLPEALLATALHAQDADLAMAAAREEDGTIRPPMTAPGTTPPPDSNFPKGFDYPQNVSPWVQARNGDRGAARGQRAGRKAGVHRPSWPTTGCGPLSHAPVTARPPVGAQGPDFINAVVALDTALAPLELLHALLYARLAIREQLPQLLVRVGQDRKSVV